jgi:hypothetical protein
MAMGKRQVEEMSARITIAQDFCLLLTTPVSWSTVLIPILQIKRLIFRL